MVFSPALCNTYTQGSVGIEFSSIDGLREVLRMYLVLLKALKLDICKKNSSLNLLDWW